MIWAFFVGFFYGAAGARSAQGNWLWFWVFGVLGTVALALFQRSVKYWAIRDFKEKRMLV